MKSTNKFSFLIYSAFSLTMISCTVPESNIRTPEPKELVTDERYREQVDAIDQERRELNLPTLTDLIAEDRVTKTPNDSEPIVIELPRDEISMDEAKEDAENGIFAPVHDKVQIEEYFVISEDDIDIEVEEQLPEETNTDVETLEDTSGSTEAVQSQNDRLQALLRQQEENARLAKENQIAPDVTTSVSPLLPPPAASPSTSGLENPAITATTIDESQTDSIEPPDADLTVDEDDSSALGSGAVTNSLRPQARKEEDNQEDETGLSETSTDESSDSVSIDEPEFDGTSDSAVSTSLRPTQRPANFAETVRRQQEQQQRNQNVSNFKARWDVNPNGSRYTRYTLDALDSYAQDLLNASNIDNANYCRNLNSLSKSQKKQFWLMVISGIARWESGFDTDAKYLESSGRYSRGLLQLDYQHRRHYRCDLSSKFDLHNAQKNLECGVKMVQKLVLQDRIVRGGSTGRWRGAARFWSVLRPNIWSGAKRRNVLTIPAEARNLSFCR